MWEQSVHSVEGQREEEAEEIGSRDPLVALSEGEHFGSHRPGDGIGIGGLHPRAGPDGCSFWGKEDRRLFLYDAELVLDFCCKLDGNGDVKEGSLPLHHDVVENGSEDTTDDLCSEGTFR